MSNKPLDPFLWSISDVFKHIYTIPVYQRPYSWEQNQVRVLLDHILDAYSLPEKEREEGYFIGSIYIHDRGENINGLIQKYDIIDGQQRLTTVSFLLLSLFSLSKIYNADESDQTFITIKQCLWKYVNRSYDKNNRAVNLNSIEKQCFTDLFDYCFIKPEEIRLYTEHYSENTPFDGIVLHNFNLIYDVLKEQFTDSNALLDFAEYFLNHVQIIAINSTCSVAKAFSIFESINSKGKPLSEIDKIKTFIFSKIDEASYEQYLNLWGQLIIATKDKLYDYFYNYIKAYISFYRQNIKVDNFKTLCRDELMDYYKKDNISDALKAMLDDMYNKVVYYSMLSDVNAANKLVNSKQFKFYFKIFTYIDYQHPRALFLRALEEYAEHKISKDDLNEVVKNTVVFALEYLSISNRDSKDSISMFSAIMKDTYEKNAIDKKVISNIIANEYISKALDQESVKSSLMKMDGYNKKKLAVVLLSLYESTMIDEKGKPSVSYDKAYTLLQQYGTAFSLDHLLVQTPDEDSKFKYYCKDEKLVLKDGHDFSPPVQDGMDYEQFKGMVINRMGNLRLYYSDENSTRRNDDSIELKDYGNFVDFAHIEKRGKEIADVLIDVCMAHPQFDPKIKKAADISENSLPSMDVMIEKGFVNVGDTLIITTNPDNSRATLLDSKHVNYNGEKMRLREWGKKVTSWTSINIYEYASVYGERETLHQKRLRLISEETQDEIYL